MKQISFSVTSVIDVYKIYIRFKGLNKKIHAKEFIQDYCANYVNQTVITINLSLLHRIDQLFKVLIKNHLQFR